MIKNRWNCENDHDQRKPKNVKSTAYVSSTKKTDDVLRDYEEAENAIFHMVENAEKTLIHAVEEEVDALFHKNGHEVRHVKSKDRLHHNKKASNSRRSTTNMANKAREVSSSSVVSREKSEVKDSTIGDTDALNWGKIKVNNIYKYAL